MTMLGSYGQLRRLRCAALVTVLSAGGVCAVPLPCRAQTTKELERARDAFREGVSLEAAGNWAAALAKFEEVGRVKLTPQVRFHIARCKEQLGRLNEALGEYRLAEYEGGQQRISELPEITHAREQLEARVPTLVITRGAGAEVARVMLDGVELGEKQIGARISVDPGPHTVTARLPGNVEFQENVTLQEHETKNIELVPPAKAAEAKPEPAAAPEASAAPAEQPESGSSVLPWVVGGVGVASLAASGIFFLLRNGAESDLEDACRGDVCPSSKQDIQDKGELYATLSMVTFGAGLVGVGVAVVLLASGSGDPAAETAQAVTLDVRGSTGGGGVTVRGSF